MRRKKGSITDLPFIMGGIFSIAIVALLVTLLVSELDVEVQSNDIFSSNAKGISSNLTDDLPNVMNGGIIFIFFAMVIVSLVLASLVPIHPIFLVFYLLEYILLIWLGAWIANAYEAIIDAAVFASVADLYALTTAFFRYFPFVIGIVGAVLAIVVYKVRRSFMQ